MQDMKHPSAELGAAKRSQAQSFPSPRSGSCGPGLDLHWAAVLLGDTKRGVETAHPSPCKRERSSWLGTAETQAFQAFPLMEMGQVYSFFPMECHVIIDPSMSSRRYKRLAGVFLRYANIKNRSILRSTKTNDLLFTSKQKCSRAAFLSEHRSIFVREKAI